MYVYEIYGLRVRSSFLIEGVENPILLEPSLLSDFDLVIESSINFDISHLTSNIGKNQGTYAAFKDDYIVVQHNDDWRLVISTKEKLIVVDESSKDLDMALNVMLGTGLSIVLLYAGYLPLHAGSFLFQDLAVAISGASGVGKSTFMRNAMNSGLKIVSDDSTPIRLVEGRIIAQPAQNIKAKLKESVMEFFNISYEQSSHISNYHTAKRWVPIGKEQRALEELELNSIYFLNPSEDESEIRIHPLTANEKISALRENVLSLNALPLMDLKLVISKIRKYSAHIGMYRIVYSKKLILLNNVLKSITDHELSIRGGKQRGIT